MKHRAGRVGGAVLMGLAWALAWAPVGVLTGTRIVDPDNSMDEMWVVVGAFPGFLSGAFYFVLLGIADGRRRWVELSLVRVGALGAVAGLLVGLLPFVLGSNETELPTWLLAVEIIGPITLLSAVSACISLVIARWWERESLDGRADVPEVRGPAT